MDLLDTNTICVHCTWLNQDDIDILEKTGAHVVSCPQSNLKLASGIAPVDALIKQNVPVGIGTDGCASNNSLDMFREMSTLAKVQKVATGEATALSARQALLCATTLGGRILGLKDTGTCKPGSKADCILVDLQSPHLTPFYNQDLLVYAARGGDVTTVFINGRLVMQNRQLLTIDIAKTMATVAALAGELKGG